MRNSLYLVILLLAFAGCSHINHGEIAAQTAKQYYDTLMQEKYEIFVDGKYKPDSIPDSYRAQLVDNAKMFIQQQNLRKGIVKVQVDSGVADAKNSTANAFLTIVYGNNTRENIVVPMVKHGVKWYMK